MRIVKNRNEISSVEDWFKFAPPKRKNHWVDGRSAMELAKAWFPFHGTPIVPPEFSCLINSSEVLGSLKPEWGEPEVTVRFDPFGGERRNCDLLVMAVTESGHVAISVEAKSDELFGNRTVAEAFRRGSSTTGSKVPERICRLTSAVLGLPVDECGTLRYQLLYGIGAALAAAKIHSASTALFVVHEFVTHLTNDVKRAQNATDLHNFLCALTKGVVGQLSAGHLVGPFRVPGNDYIPKSTDLFIGKAVREKTDGTRLVS